MGIIEDDVYGNVEVGQEVENPIEEVSGNSVFKEIDEIEEAEPRSYTLSADEFGDDLEIEGDDIKEDGSDGDDEDYSGVSVGGDMELEMEPEGDESDGNLYSPEERLSILADKVMAVCVNDWVISKKALAKLLRMPSPNIFRGENFIIFSVLLHYRGKLNYISIDDEFLRLFLNRNRKIITNAGNFIDISAYGEVDGSEELGYIAGVIKHYKRLRTFDEMNELEFETTFEKYLIEFQALEMSRVLQQAKTILTDGLKVGRRKLFGFDDSEMYIKQKTAEIKGLVTLEEGSGFVNMRDLAQRTDDAPSYKVGDFYKIEALNKLYGGLYTGMMYSWLAPPKTGKSKFLANLVWNAVVNFGTNVTVIPAEGGKDAFFAELRAIHFNYLYNSGVDAAERKYGVSQDAILHNKFPSEELRQLESSSKFDLITNENYGSVEFIDKPFLEETFIDDLDTSLKSNNSTLIAVDYLQYIGSLDPRRSDENYVSSAYKKALNFCKSRNVCFLTPGQIKQETFDKLAGSKSTDSIDMRTAGAKSSESIRTPDIIMAIWATTEDIQNQRIKFLSVPSRFSRPFQPIDVAINYESSQFIGLDDAG